MYNAQKYIHKKLTITLNIELILYDTNVTIIEDNSINNTPNILIFFLLFLILQYDFNCPKIVTDVAKITKIYSKLLIIH